MVSDSMIQRSWTEYFISVATLPPDYPSTASKKVLIGLVEKYFQKEVVDFTKNLPFNVSDCLRVVAGVAKIRILTVGEFSAKDRTDSKGKKLNNTKARKSLAHQQTKNHNIDYVTSYNKVVAAIPLSSAFTNEWLKSKEFLQSMAWKKARYAAILFAQGRCLCCGQNAKQHGAVICVDHIKPRKTHPQLSLSIGNLQVLCEKCNAGKGNLTEDDWR